MKEALRAYRLYALLLPMLSLLLSCGGGDDGKSRYYGESYNFIVDADSMMLLRFLPSESSLFNDTVYVRKGEIVAVADIISSDSLDLQSDTAWVQLLKDDTTFGWIEEEAMKQSVVPDDPISQGISLFSDNHLAVFLVVIAVMLIAYILRHQYKRGAPMVHFNDIGTAYPAVLCVLVALAASLYASIQMFAPAQWQNYYYHPTLNPLEEAGLIAWFLTAVWVIIIMAVACISEVFKRLRAVEATLYLCGLFAFCSANYIIYSQLTPLYVGYPLLALYIAFAFYMIIKPNNHEKN